MTQPYPRKHSRSPPKPTTKGSHQLDEKLGLDPSGALVLRVRARRQQGVDLVDEDDGRLQRLGHREQRLDHLFALADPLRGQRRGADGEEG